MGERSDDLGPGLHVLREAEPLKRAGTMAAQLQAELCATLPQADALLAAWSDLPVVDTTTLHALRTLAGRLARTERIVERTRERATAEVSRQLSGSSGIVAVHPETVRQRAAAVDQARDALEAAIGALDAHDLAPDAAEAASHPSASLEAAARSEARTEGVSRQRRARVIGVLLASFGVAALLGGTGVVPLWGALLVPLVGSLWAGRHLRTGEEDRSGRSEASSLLAEMSASTDELFGARRAAKASAEHRLALELRRDRAEEELRVAQRAWHELAGVDVDSSDVDEVVRRFDPQHEDAQLLASHTVGVRAVELVLHQLQQRWSAFWRELDLDAPALRDAEPAVESLAARVTRPIVLVGPATARAADLARLVPAAPVVVLDGPVTADG